MHRPTIAKAHARDPASGQEQPLDGGAGQHPQVGALAHGREKGLGGAPANATALVYLEIGRTFIVAAVEVVDLGDAELLAGVADRVENVPVQPLRLDAPFAALPVQRVVVRVVILGPSEIGKDVVPAPAHIAELAPLV